MLKAKHVINGSGKYTFSFLGPKRTMKQEYQFFNPLFCVDRKFIFLNYENNFAAAVKY